MKIAIANPVRIGASGGFIKHLLEIIPRMSASHRCSVIDIITPAGCINGLEKAGARIVEVPGNDFRHGFKKIRRIIDNGNYDVALSTTARPLKLACCPLVTVVQNIEPIQTPRYRMPFLWRMRLLKLRHEYAVACRHAAGIIAVSANTRTEICRRFGVPPNKVEVIYHGYAAAADGFRKPDIFLPEAPFIFSAGSIVPYRGYEDIIRAIAHIKKSYGHAPVAVLAGKGDMVSRPYEKSLKKLAKALMVDDLIVWAGQLDSREMSWCYRNAALFIQSSRAEACPNIVLEAMGHQCRSISCDQPPMPEIYHDAAEFYPMGDAKMLAGKICRCLNQTEAQAVRFRIKAQKRASSFSWDIAADRTLNLLERTVNQP